MLIPCAKSTIDREAATRKLRGGLKRLGRARFVGAFDFYIPYRRFGLQVTNRGQSAAYMLAVDSVVGDLDLWSLDAQTAGSGRVLINTDRYAMERLPEKRAVEVIIEKVKRQIYLKGFFKIRDLEVDAKFIETFYIPYWVGVYQRNDSVRLDVVNGLNGVMEGVKLRDVVADWFQRSG